jgi:beta-glucanase (GH16 family)
MIRNTWPAKYTAKQLTDGTWKVRATWDDGLLMPGVRLSRSTETHEFITRRAPVSRSDCLRLYREAAGVVSRRQVRKAERARAKRLGLLPRQLRKARRQQRKARRAAKRGV